MSGIQHSTLSDEEFERLVYMAMGSAGALPAEVANELAQRNRQDGRDWEHLKNTLDTKQQTLPFDTK